MSWRICKLENRGQGMFHPKIAKFTKAPEPPNQPFASFAILG